MLFLSCRLLLAAIHYNENTDRPQAQTSNGQPIFRIRFPKYKKGGFTVTPAKPSPTYGMSLDGVFKSTLYISITLIILLESTHIYKVH